MKERVNIKVSGKVQGVFFRASTVDIARKMGIDGWVTNMPDGSVYVEAEADPEKLDTFIKWLHTGPDLSRVDQVIVEDSSPLGESGFQIRH